MHFRADKSAESHERLLIQSSELQIQHRETFDEYIRKNIRLRYEMTLARYPEIDNEATKGDFAVMGLRAWPDLAL